VTKPKQHKILNKSKVFKDFTNLDAKTLHPGDQDAGAKQPPHGLSTIHGELTAVEILIDVRRIRVAQSHGRHSLTRVPAFAAAVDEAPDGGIVVFHRGIGGSGGDPILLGETAAADVVVVGHLFYCNQYFARSLSWKHIVQ